MHQATIGVELRQSEGQTWLELSTDVLAQSVSIDCEGYRPTENGFHLAPGHRKSVVLHAQAGAPAVPSGSIRSLGGLHPTIF
jgi:beta-mannosidase